MSGRRERKLAEREYVRARRAERHARAKRTRECLCYAAGEHKACGEHKRCACPACDHKRSLKAIVLPVVADTVTIEPSE